WRLIDYFKSHARRVHVAIGTGSVTGDAATARIILDWLKGQRNKRFSLRDLTQARRSIRSKDPEGGLAYLERHGAIRLIQSPKDGPKRGRPHSLVYEVNPLLFS